MRTASALLLLALALPLRGEVATLETQERIPAPPAYELTLNGWSYGPPVGNFRSRVPNVEGKLTTPISVVTQVAGAFRISNRWQFAIVPAFSLQPFEGVAFEALNPTIGVQSDIFKEGSRGGFGWWTRIENAVPLAKVSREAGMVLGPQAVNTFAFRPLDTKWLLRLVAVPSVTYFADGTSSIALYASPQIHYLFSDNFRLVALLETYLARPRNAGSWDIGNSQPSNFGAGFRYTVGNGAFWIQPFVNLYPSGQLNADTAHVAFFFGGKIL